MEQFEVAIVCWELEGESLTNSSDIYSVGLGIGGLRLDYRGVSRPGF